MSERAPRDSGASERFGKLYAELTDQEPTDSQLAAQRARLLLRARREGLPRFVRPSTEKWISGRLLLAMVPALALGVALLVFWPWRSDQPLTAQWRGGAVSVGAEITAASGDELGFSDGSRIVFEPDTAGRMLALQDKHTEVRVLRGRVAADINRETGATWDLVAGPYRVSVIGTKFTVEWDPAHKRFAVDVTQGKVQVSGGDLGAGGVAVAAGEKVVREPEPDVTASEAAVAQATEVTDLEPADGPEVDVDAQGERRQLVVTRPKARASIVDPDLPEEEAAEAEREAGPTWQQLAQAGSYQAAYLQASSLGFDGVMAGLGAEELLLLANTARYAGRNRDAGKAYQALRERYPASAGARIAAFYLARVAQDANGQPRVAVRWLKTYLKEAPNGHLAATARARLIDTLLQLGDHGGAREVARDYIRLHPDGPHIGLARSLIRSSGRR